MAKYPEPQTVERRENQWVYHFNGNETRAFLRRRGIRNADHPLIPKILLCGLFPEIFPEEAFCDDKKNNGFKANVLCYKLGYNDDQTLEDKTRKIRIGNYYNASPRDIMIELSVVYKYDIGHDRGNFVADVLFGEGISTVKLQAELFCDINLQFLPSSISFDQLAKWMFDNSDDAVYEQLKVGPFRKKEMEGYQRGYRIEYPVMAMVSYDLRYSAISETAALYEKVMNLLLQGRGLYQGYDAVVTQEKTLAKARTDIENIPTVYASTAASMGGKKFDDHSKILEEQLALIRSPIAVLNRELGELKQGIEERIQEHFSPLREELRAHYLLKDN